MRRSSIATAITATCALGVGVALLTTNAIAGRPEAAPSPVVRQSVPAAPSPSPSVPVSPSPSPSRPAAKPKPKPVSNAASKLDRRCLSGRVICVDKSRRMLYWVVDGDIRMSMSARFGGRGHRTRNGSFRVYMKSRNHVSKLYHTAMPFAMFFSGGQAVHYSRGFARQGYGGASHGCVNVRNWAGVRSLFNQVRNGDRVVVYS